MRTCSTWDPITPIFLSDSAFARWLYLRSYGAIGLHAWIASLTLPLTQSGCMLTTWLCSGSMSNVELDMMYLRGKEANVAVSASRTAAVLKARAVADVPDVRTAPNGAKRQSGIKRKPALRRTGAAAG